MNTDFSFKFQQLLYTALMWCVQHYNLMFSIWIYCNVWDCVRLVRLNLRPLY